MPLMYVILKDAGTDIDEATRRIEEGKPKQNNEIALTRFVLPLWSTCNINMSINTYISIYTYLIRSRQANMLWMNTPVSTIWISMTGVSYATQRGNVDDNFSINRTTNILLKNFA